MTGLFLNTVYLEAVGELPKGVEKVKAQKIDNTLGWLLNCGYIRYDDDILVINDVPKDVPNGRQNLGILPEDLNVAGVLYTLYDPEALAMFMFLSPEDRK